MRRVAGLLGLGVTALTLARPSVAAPVVEIHARSEIILDPVKRAAGGLQVSGVLRERASAEPIGFASVLVSIDGNTATTMTGPDGRFAQFFPVEGGRHRVSVEFTGLERRAAHKIDIPDLDVAKRPVTLAVSAPPRHSRDTGGLEIQIQAQEEFDPLAGLKIDVHLGPAEAVRESLPRLATATTDESGAAILALPADKLGAPGHKSIDVRFAGSDVFDAARAQASTTIVSSTTITFETSSREIDFEGRITGEGRLVDDQKKGIAGQPVSLRVSGVKMAAEAAAAPAPPAPAAPDDPVRGGGRTVDETVTDADGNFRLEARASELGPGVYKVQAVFSPVVMFLEGDHSPLAEVKVAEKRPVPVAYSLAAFAITAASILAFVALRTQPWKRWLRRLRPEGAGPAGDAAARQDAAPHTGLALARPGLAATLRRPHDLGFSGVVADSVSGRPIGGALVELVVQGGEPRAVATDDAGQFTLEELAPGEHAASVSCAGYVTERFAVTIPHRGELRGARVDLLPVRERIFSLYRAAAEPLLPKPDLWGVWTPRQIVDHVREHRPAKALAALTDYVEEKYFSQRVPLEEEIPAAHEHVIAAQREIGPPAA